MFYNKFPIHESWFLWITNCENFQTFIKVFLSFISGTSFYLRSLRFVTWHLHLFNIVEVTTETYFYPWQEAKQVEKSWMGAGQQLLFFFSFFFEKCWYHYCISFSLLFVVTSWSVSAFDKSSIASLVYASILERER